ncbi:vam6/Vps39-like protein [Actinia tenebrosa]|uniref:Vam6/Vps39-like protein n=1 Tax=Actinia tenebrosa TaxID=6105 RepID=A0A6P8IJ74_ACTTE|nr:vam6/Vps39-like protein [Actinia tenebrosa]
MHDAFEHVPILEKLPLQIECIATHGEYLLVGTRQGHLLVYSLKNATGENRFKADLRSSNKLFSKKPILQLAVVEEFNLLISLSDAVVNCHHLDTFVFRSSLAKTKGATFFAVDLVVRKTSSVFDPSPPFELKLCAAVKKKIQLYTWQKGEFQETPPELGLPDIVRAVAWAGPDNLCVGFKREYSIIKVSTGSTTDLFSTGKHLEPTIATLPDGGLILCRDDMSIITDVAGKHIQKQSLTWSDTPIAIDYVAPYVIGILPKYVEVRTISPRALIQSMELQKPRFVAKGKHIFIASNSYVWRLVPVSFPMQIQQLLQDKQFNLALMLAELVEEPTAEKARRKENIQNLYAFELFCQKRFDESLQLFARLQTDPAQVIGLFPDLLPPDFRKQLEYPDLPPDLKPSEVEKGYVALIEYLTQKRNELIKAADVADENQKDPAEQPSELDIKAQKNLRQRQQIIDTTLLKCYLQTNDALVSSLLRLKDNSCHVEESERVLMKYKKYKELVVLYQTKGLHKKALDLLLRQAQKASGPLKGHQKTVQYLQRLGREHLKLIFDFSVWVLKAHPDDGLKIFTEDLPEVEGLPRDQVLEHIELNAKDLVIRYLEHVIFIWFEPTSKFHNKLINCYREKVQLLMNEYLDSLHPGEKPVPPGSEPGELGELRGRLLFLLETSKHYQAETLLTHFQESFYYERALLLGRVGRHEEALSIYIHILNDPKLAEEYCLRTYSEEREGSSDVYVSLLRLYLEPADVRDTPVKPNIPAALNVLKEHHQKISTAKALELLPSNIEVREVYEFLMDVLKGKEIKRKRSQVLRSLLYAEHLQIQEQRMFYQARKIIITEERVCRECHKRIGNSAFAYYPSGEIKHYYCYKDPDASTIQEVALPSLKNGAFTEQTPFNQ